MDVIDKYRNEDLMVERNPYLYYTLVEIVNSVGEDQEKRLKDIRKKMESDISVLKQKRNVLFEASHRFMEESKAVHRSKANPVMSLEQAGEDASAFMHQNLNFVVLLFEIVDAIQRLYSDIYNMSKSLKKPNIISSGKRITDFFDMANFDRVTREIDLNGRALESYAMNIDSFNNNTNLGQKLGENLYRGLEEYYKMLLNRHSVQGTKIFRQPVITDIAIRIFENVDSHGEIESGKKKNEVSAYTLRKAEVLAKTLKDDMVHDYLVQPDSFLRFIGESLINLELFVEAINEIYRPQLEKLYENFGQIAPKKSSKLQEILANISDINPSNISYVESKKMLTETEKMMEEIKTETLKNVVELIADKETSFEKLVDYILERKAELKKFFHEENCFYVCKIGTGNMFAGEAPGGLEVVPMERPKGNINDIIGSGFDEVREFAQSIKSSAKWHNLFVATSPSKSADKSNVLLIGPPGCGKTEVMRAIGAQTESISIFAQSSDFKTAWAHESNKNPKRLFEAGIKMNKEANKHVNFLLDEIDEILNNDFTLNNDNLTKEFQILMDGIVSYPNLSVWGATNNPERIPTAILRRFSKVLIVGELDEAQRIKLLKHYMGVMPLDEFTEEQYNEWSKKLEGATGDVVRKVADVVWRKKMNKFVTTHEKEAEEVLNWINSQGEFKIQKLDRTEFKKVLGQKMKVYAKDVDSSIEECINNVAISQEIKDAIDTYKKAKEFLNKLKKERHAEEQTEEKTEEKA